MKTTRNIHTQDGTSTYGADNARDLLNSMTGLIDHDDVMMVRTGELRERLIDFIIEQDDSIDDFIDYNECNSRYDITNSELLELITEAMRRNII